MQVVTGDPICSDAFDCSGCVLQSEEDKAFHGILEKIAEKELNTKVSIYDIPMIFDSRMPENSPNYYNYPTYTLCQLEPKTRALVQNPLYSAYGFPNNCSIDWQNYIEDSRSFANPYKIEDNVCAQGLGNHVM